MVNAALIRMVNTFLVLKRIISKIISEGYISMIETYVYGRCVWIYMCYLVFSLFFFFILY